MYFGSVRFFKNLILLVVVILIAVPTILAVRFGLALRSQKQEAVPPAPSGKAGEIHDVYPDRSDAAPSDSDSAVPLGEAAEPIDYQDLYPDFYAPAPYGADQRVTGTIYLTFDDGPSDCTADILRILAEKDVKATFFVTGQTTEAGLQRMRDIVAAGHTIGMHSFSHSYTYIYSSVESFLDDMYRIFVQIRDATGVTPTLFRFPGGSINAYNAGIYQELIAEMMRRGFVPCDWNLSAEDAANVSPYESRILQNIVEGARSRGVERGFVLMHDSAHAVTTINALSDVIDQLRDLGYEFDSLTPETKPVLFGYRDHE